MTQAFPRKTKSEQTTTEVTPTVVVLNANLRAIDAVTVRTLFAERALTAVFTVGAGDINTCAIDTDLLPGTGSAGNGTWWRVNRNHCGPIVREAGEPKGQTEKPHEEGRYADVKPNDHDPWVPSVE